MRRLSLAPVRSKSGATRVGSRASLTSAAGASEGGAAPARAGGDAEPKKPLDSGPAEVPSPLADSGLRPALSIRRATTSGRRSTAAPAAAAGRTLSGDEANDETKELPARSLSRRISAKSAVPRARSARHTVSFREPGHARVSSHRIAAGTSEALARPAGELPKGGSCASFLGSEATRVFHHNREDGPRLPEIEKVYKATIEDARGSRQMLYVGLLFVLTAWTILTWFIFV